jgi:AAA domain
MLTISKPLSASQAQTYHAREFASQEQSYWSRDQLDGIAGAGKTTTLSVIREGAEAEGFRVEGFAPTE